MQNRNGGAHLAQPTCKAAAIFLSLLLMSGCVTTGSNVQTIDQLETMRENPRIVLMPPDIRYYLLSAGGIPEPHAEWTAAARENFAAAIKEYADSMGTDLKILDESNMSSLENKYEELHSAVGMTVLTSYFGPYKLPGKNNQFDWSLGPGVRAIGEEHDADYALFVYYRDRQASGGRVAFAILAAVAGGVSDTGSESGFASLVDLRTGDIVWFNVVTAGSGELRKKEGAAAAVAKLFKDIPTNQKQ
jgi:hypothetical protein